MTKEQISQLIGIGIGFALMVLAVFGYHVTVVQPLQEQVASLDGGGAPLETRGVTGFEDLAVASVTTTGDIGVGDDLTLGGSLINSATAVTLTAGLSITPATSLYLIDSTGAVSMTLAACGAATPQVVLLYGRDNNTVTVNDTNIRTTDGNAVTFGQFDMVGFQCANGEWNHLFKSANQ